MNKTMWARPNARVEEFAANEYVAVCWGVACDYGITGGEAGLDDYFHNGGHSTTPPQSDSDHGTTCKDYIHTKRSDKTGCGWLANQSITQNEDGSYTLKELNAQGLPKELTITITDSNWGNGVSTLSKDTKVGDLIYWTTSNGSRTWSHKGTIAATSNRS